MEAVVLKTREEEIFVTVSFLLHLLRIVRCGGHRRRKSKPWINQGYLCKCATGSSRSTVTVDTVRAGIDFLLVTGLLMRALRNHNPKGARLNWYVRLTDSGKSILHAPNPFQELVQSIQKADDLCSGRGNS
jgi:hypothetical protein